MNDQDNKAPQDNPETQDKPPEPTNKPPEAIPYARFQEVNQRMKEAETKLKEFQAQQEEQKKKALEEQNKFQELYEQEKQSREAEKTTFANNAKKTALQIEALKQGTIDADAVVALADLNGVELAEDGSVNTETVQKAISSLKESKSYLFGSQEAEKPKNIGNSAGAGVNPTSGRTYTQEEINNMSPSEYQKVKDDIRLAVLEGRVKRS